MHRPVAKDTHVPCVEKVRDVAQIGNRFLRLVRETVVAGGQSIEEAAVEVQGFELVVETQ
jgi:hypothetical protein